MPTMTPIITSAAALDIEAHLSAVRTECNGGTVHVEPFVPITTRAQRNHYNAGYVPTGLPALSSRRVNRLRRLLHLEKPPAPVVIDRPVPVEDAELLAAIQSDARGISLVRLCNPAVASPVWMKVGQ